MKPSVNMYWKNVSSLEKGGSATKSPYGSSPEHTVT